MHHPAYISLAIVLLLFGALGGAGLVVIMAIAILRPPRMTDGKAIWVMQRLSPADVGLAFEETSFAIRDLNDEKPLKIAGWWIPAPLPSRRCVILIHGYADAKVGAVAFAPMLHRMGFNILAIDLRAHGQSGGVYSTGGYWERADVERVIDQLRAEKPAESAELLLFGMSIGATTAAAVAARRSDLAAAILDSPTGDYRLAAMRQMDLVGAPGKPFQQLAIRLAEKIAKCDFADVRTADQIQKANCPIMLILPAGDSLVSDAERTGLHQALTARQQPLDHLYEPPTDHLQAYFEDPEGYEKRLAGFINSLPTGG